MACLRRNWFVLVLAVSTAWSSLAAAQQVAESPVKAQPASVKPAPRNDKWWMDRHEKMNQRVKQGNVDMVLIGDSITHGWEGAPEVWNEFFGKRNAVNLGIGGDQTQHVLWRLENGNLEGISPKLAVVMIGTNNAGSGQKPEEIVEGVKAVVETLRRKAPNTTVLVLAIFPRGANTKDHLRQVNTEANAQIAKLADGKKVIFLDIGPKFLDAEGNLSKEVMPDLLHLTPKSYRIWAETMEPTVAKIMGGKE